MSTVEAFPHLEAVEGWLEPPTARITQFLLAYQTARELTGDLLEIGVYAGKYFLVLAAAAQDLEQLVAIDIFESEGPAIPSVQGSRAVFEANLQKYAPSRHVYIMESNSRELTPQLITTGMGTTERRPFRFISIDGSHDEETVASDLKLAEGLLMSGGIVALDDWTPAIHPQWPGVIDGETRYQAEGGGLLHIGSIPNKLLLSNGPFWVREYQQILREYRDSEE